MDTIDYGDFHTNRYLRINQRRLEHLVSLGLDLRSRTVLELGAGIGDLSTFFLDRDCKVTSVEVRSENLQRMTRNIEAYYASYPGSSRPACHRAVGVDLDSNGQSGLGLFEIVFCYGLLYHVRDPARVIQQIDSVCTRLCLVETCVSFGPEEVVDAVSEDAGLPSQAFHGIGCRPTRAWVLRALRQAFPYVYVPRTQPDHEEFPVNWSVEPAEGLLTRAIFVASREPLDNRILQDCLPDRQTRC